MQMVLDVEQAVLNHLLISTQLKMSPFHIFTIRVHEGAVLIIFAENKKEEPDQGQPCP
ncbi:hypothetical protein D3C81_2289690 [compost metagenome]